MKEILYRNYRLYYGHELETEANTLYQLDGQNKTRYSRRKNKDGLLLEASRLAHEQRKVYWVTILEDGIAKYYITFTSVFISVDFLDDKGRTVKSYQFDKVEPNKLMVTFMNLYEYHDDSDDLDVYLLYSYKADGSFAHVERFTTRKGMERRTEQIDYIAHSKVDISDNFAPYPEFGHYDELIREDRVLFTDYQSLECTKKTSTWQTPDY